MAANFNDATAHMTFPPLKITNEQATAQSSPSLGDPGFIVEFTDGTWVWADNIETARNGAGTTGAIYPAWEVCDYFRQFAEEAHINPKTGKETLSGPLE